MTEDNCIIFNNLIIGQAANDHTAAVNTLRRRIELHSRLIRLITAGVRVRGSLALRRVGLDFQKKRK